MLRSITSVDGGALFLFSLTFILQGLLLIILSLPFNSIQFNSIKKLDYMPYVARLFVGYSINLLNHIYLLPLFTIELHYCSVASPGLVLG